MMVTVAEGRKPQIWRGDREEAGKKISEALKNSDALKQQSANIKAKKSVEYIQFLADNLPHVQLVGEYTKALVDAEHLCTKHDVRFSTRPNNIKNGKVGCIQCESEAKSLMWTKQDPAARAAKIRETNLKRYGMPNAGEFFKEKSAATRILNSVKHLDEERKAQYFDKAWWDDHYVDQNKGTTWVMDYFDIKIDVVRAQMDRLGIPLMDVRASGAETIIADAVRDMGYEVVLNDRQAIKPKEIDVFIPELNLGIEHHGIYWHSEEVNPDPNHHRDKLRLADHNGVRLIQVWEDDFQNNREVVLKFIRNQLKRNPNRIGARQCSLTALTQDEFNRFLDNNHMQGSTTNSSIRLGLLKENAIVAVMGFAKCPINVTKYGPGVGYELTRFASVGVAGAFSKLLKHFRKSHTHDFIYSFADLEIVSRQDNVYLKQGFKEHHEVAPDYKYTDGHRRHHKFMYRKEKFKAMGYDIEGKTEAELAKEAKLHRCWDSGKIAYILK